MKSIYVRNLIKWYFSRKKIIICCLVIFILLFGLLGVRQAYPEKLPVSISEDVQEYQAAVQKYDDAIAAMQENITTAQGQVDSQQKYCDESVYMQIDSSNIQQVTLQYRIKFPESQKDGSTIMNAWVSYINSGSLKSELAEKMDSIPDSYLSEILSASASGNMLLVVFRHYDMEQAASYMQVVRELIDAHCSELQSSFGDFELELIDYAELAVADSNVQDTQNSKLNNLKYFKTSLTELQDKLVTLQTTRDQYVQQYKPAGVSSSSPKKTLIEYVVLGVLAGILVPFVVIAVMYTLSGRLKSKDELLAAELNVLAQYGVRKSFVPSLERVIMDIQLLAGQREVSSVVISSLGKTKLIRQVSAELADRLKERKLDIISVEFGTETAEELQAIAECGNTILVVEAGNTTYTQIEEQMQFCHRFKISVWGCIVIE